MQLQGNDNDLSGTNAATIRVKRDGVTVTSWIKQWNSGPAVSIHDFTRTFVERRTVTTAVTYSVTVEEAENGVPRDTIDATGTFSLDPTYEVPV